MDIRQPNQILPIVVNRDRDKIALKNRAAQSLLGNGCLSRGYTE